VQFSPSAIVECSAIAECLALTNFGSSRSRRIKNLKKYVIKVLISNHSNQISEFYKNLIKKGPVLILREIIIIHINLRWHLCNEKHISASIVEKTKKTTNKTFGRRNFLKLRPP
jgi:3-isopropylmalate dehydratase small subunit